MVKIIKAEELTISDLPDEDASWPEIFDFAITFDSMLEFGTTDIYKPEFIKHDEGYSLQELRRSLYLWQRGWNFVGGKMKKVDYKYLEFNNFDEEKINGANLSRLNLLLLLVFIYCLW